LSWSTTAVLRRIGLSNCQCRAVTTTLLLRRDSRLSTYCCITWDWSDGMSVGTSRLLGGITVLLGLVLAWELLSHIVTAKGSYDEPLIPGWGYLIGTSLLRMSDYWGGGFGVPAPSEGGKPTYAAALLA